MKRKVLLAMTFQDEYPKENTPLFCASNNIFNEALAFFIDLGTTYELVLYR